MEPSEKRNIVRMINNLFIASVGIPCLVMIAGFVEFFLIMRSAVGPDSVGGLLKNMIIAASVSGAVTAAAGVFVVLINRRKYSYMKKLFEVQRKRVAVIDSAAAIVGMAAVMVAVFAIPIGGAVSLINLEEGQFSSSLLALPIYVTGLVFLPCLLPTFLTQRKVKMMMTK